MQGIQKTFGFHWKQQSFSALEEKLCSSVQAVKISLTIEPAEEPVVIWHIYQMKILSFAEDTAMSIIRNIYTKRPKIFN